jgi:MEDS: MEthanogen/methylotroph, DcmR Sensory domain
MTPNYEDSNPAVGLSPDTRLPYSSDHFVEFYEDDSYLMDSLGRFISLGLTNGEAAIVIAEPGHRKALRATLGGIGIHLEDARKDGILTLLDASDTLAVFMRDGAPDPGIFKQVIGNIIERAAAGGRNVRIFGEMVALLWARGNVTGALRLEDLWNELAQSHPFRLFCAYPVEGFAGRELAELSSVCNRHTHVLAAAETTF